MISFIIVSYNSGSTIFNTIDSIIQSTSLPFQVIVVDNNSPDKAYLSELEQRDEIILVKSELNLGFAKANNVGVLRSTGDVLFFVNPDVFLNRNSVSVIINSLKSKTVVTSKLYDEFGSCNNSVYLIPFLSNYFTHILNGKGKLWVHGALLVFNRTDFFEIGLWSEEFFMYSEDVDLCYKVHLKKLNLKILNEKVIHVGGTSTSVVWSDLERAIIVEKSSYLFYKKYNKVFDYYLINFLVVIKLLLTGNGVAKNKFISIIETIKNA